MKPEATACYLRTLRRRSGLSQRELAEVLGFHSETSVARHERSITIPNLLTAIGYEVVFNVPATQIFPGLYDTVETGIEERLARMEEELQQRSAKGRDAAATARKLEFFCERRNPEII